MASVEVDASSARGIAFRARQGQAGMTFLGRLRVGVSKVGGFFVHKSLPKRFAEKSTLHIRETTMKESLSDTQEAQAQKLAQAIAHASYDDILHIARTLVATDNASLFGDTEFTVRTISHRIAATAYRQHLEQKKTATKGPA